VALANGTKLGPYEIVAPVGAGEWGKYIGRGTRAWTAPSRRARLLWPVTVGKAGCFGLLSLIQLEQI